MVGLSGVAVGNFAYINVGKRETYGWSYSSRSDWNYNISYDNSHSLSLSAAFTFETGNALMTLDLAKNTYEGYEENTNFSTYSINRILLYVVK